MTLQHSKTLKAVLLIAGVLLIVVGSQIILAPDAFYATAGIKLGDDVNLHNEIKAPSVFLLASGAFVIAGVFVPRLVHASASLATAIYLSYAGSRVVSMALDGLPGSGLIHVTLLEAVVGLACLVALLRHRGKLSQAV